MKIAIVIASNITSLVNAAMNILDDAGYNVAATSSKKYIIVDTTGKTAIDSQYRGTAVIYDLGSQMGSFIKATEPSVARAVNAIRAVKAAAPARPTSAPVSNGTVRVGDLVVRVKMAKRSKFNAGTSNKVLKVTGFTQSGKLILDGLAEDQYASKKFAKVTLESRTPRSGEKVAVIKESSKAQFKLGLNNIHTFRGVTVEGGAYILDGLNEHQYAASRFSVVKGL
jgi:hypothetical protein